MKKILKTIAINLLVFCALIVGLEILGQFAYLIKTGRVLLTSSPGYRDFFEIHPYLVGRPKASVKVSDGKKIISTTNIHTRWTGADPNDQNLIRIAILGGSTAFGARVTDKDSWPAILQAKLGKQYAVINYGVPGYSTAENIIQMALVVPAKRPDIVIYYEGWNDIRNYHDNKALPDYYSHGMSQYGNLGVPVYLSKHQCLKHTFAILWLADWIKNELTNSGKPKYKLYDSPDPYVDKIYTRNLRTLKLLADKIDSFSIFIPQILNYADYNGKEGSYRWTKHISNSAMSTLMSKFNARMNDICAYGEDNCTVLNKVLNEKWNPDDFVDQGHFSRNGGEKFAEVITRFIHSEFDGGTDEKQIQTGAAPARESATPPTRQ